MLSRILKEVEEGKEVIVTARENAGGADYRGRIGSAGGERAVPADGRLPRQALRWDKDVFDPLTDPELVELGWDYMVDAPLATLPDKPKDQ